jgi:hypothetical protein
MYEDDDANAAVAPVTGTGPRYAYRIPIPDHRAFQPSSLEITLGNRLGGGDPNMLVGYRLGALGDRIAAQNDYRTFLQEAMERQQQVAAMADATARRGQDAQITRTALQQPTYASLFDLSRQQITPEGLATMGQLPGLDVRRREADIENTLAQAAQRRASGANAGSDRNAFTMSQWFAASRGLMQREAALNAQEQRLIVDTITRSVPSEQIQRDAQGRVMATQENIRRLPQQQQEELDRLRAQLAEQRQLIARERAALEAVRPPNMPPLTMDEVSPPTVTPPAITPETQPPAASPPAPAAVAPTSAAPAAPSAPATPSVGGAAALQEARTAGQVGRVVMELPPERGRPDYAQITAYISGEIAAGRLPQGSRFHTAANGNIVIAKPNRETVSVPYNEVIERARQYMQRQLQQQQ